MAEEPGVNYTGRRKKKPEHELTRVDRWRRANPEKGNAGLKAARAAALAFLGNHCIQCGFADVRALQIDHVRSNGSEERRKLTQYRIYQRVLEVPEDYQLLCANCNWIKRAVARECRWDDD